MEIEEADIPDVRLLELRYFTDHRGYFVETYNERVAQKLGLNCHFVQDNQSLSIRRGTVRGLHFQVPPKAQAKLVRVLRGSIYGVVVDLRSGSPAYGRWIGVTLTAAGGRQLFVPRGFAHGFCTLEPNTEVAYKVDEYYAPELEQGLIWNDPMLAIDWPVAPADAVLSERDRVLGVLAEFVTPFKYGEQ
jgi:dTDP-4-dehydrorhamnose 3,5-epimerase